jgi:hypothetical protein
MATVLSYYLGLCTTLSWRTPAVSSFLPNKHEELDAEVNRFGLGRDLSTGDLNMSFIETIFFIRVGV